MMNELATLAGGAKKRLLLPIEEQVPHEKYAYADPGLISAFDSGLKSLPGPLPGQWNGEYATGPGPRIDGGAINQQMPVSGTMPVPMGGGGMVSIGGAMGGAGAGMSGDLLRSALMQQLGGMVGPGVAAAGPKRPVQPRRRGFLSGLVR